MSKQQQQQHSQAAPPSSPLQCLSKAQLTASGLLLLDRSDGEVELMRRDGMELRSISNPNPSSCSSNSAWSDRDTDLTATLTTHRLVLSSPSSSLSSSTTKNNNDKTNEVRFLHLSNLHAVNKVAGSHVLSFATSSPKISLATYSLGELHLVFRSSSSSSNSNSKMSPATKDRDDMLHFLETSLQRRAWETASRLQEKQRLSDTVTRRKVGVDAILTKQKLKHQQAAKLTDEAFEGDAETLLREATELVNIIHKYVRTLEQQQQQTTTTTTSSSGARQVEQQQDHDDTHLLTDMLQDMGMTSALSKHNYRSHDDYHELLARQLADFCRPKLTTTTNKNNSKASSSDGDAVGGIQMMTLTDLYCLFNRARGTNLISPQDLLRAAQIMSTLRLGMTLREFPESGVLVLQNYNDDDDDDDSNNKLPRQLQEWAPLTALELGRKLHISVLLAGEQLRAAERQGYLCRDVTLESTTFYANRFDEFSVSSSS